MIHYLPYTYYWVCRLQGYKSGHSVDWAATGCWVALLEAGAGARLQVGDDDLVVDVVLLVVGLLDDVVGTGGLGGGRLGVVDEALAALRPHLVAHLDDDVADEADDQHAAHHVQLHPLAQVRAVRVRDHEARRLPQPEVAERRLLVAPEQRPVDT